MLVLTAQGKLHYDAMLFANVGHDSENPDTLAYLERVAKPYAASIGIPFHELQRPSRKTLYGDLVGDNRSIRIPAYMASGAPGRRSCTANYKINVIASWTKRHGATPSHPATVGLGISLDEMERMNTSRIPWQINEYPLIDLRLTRQACVNLIMAAGLPIPPRSSCYFCPYKTHSEWQRLRAESPELFERACQLERRLNEKRAMLGKDAVFLHRSLIPLEQAVGDQMTLFEDMACESGYCMT